MSNNYELYQRFLRDYEAMKSKDKRSKPAPAIDYDILAEKVAVKVVALLGKKKRRAKR